MEQQNDQSPSSGQPQIEDLALNQDRAEEVKGGNGDKLQPYLKIKLEEVRVSSWQTGSGHSD